MGGKLNPVRRTDWQSRLSTCIEGALTKPFEWGRHDCALFAADAIQAMTDVDLATGFRGRYSTETGSVRRLRSAGHSDQLQLAASLLPEIDPAFATDGDVCSFVAAGWTVLGVYVGDLIAAPGIDGLTFVPRTDATRAFHVPFMTEAS